MKFTTRTRSYGDRREDTRTRLEVRPVDDHRGQRVHDPAPRVVNIVRAHQRLLFVPEHAAHLVRGGVLDERVLTSSRVVARPTSKTQSVSDLRGRTDGVERRASGVESVERRRR